MMVTSLQEKYQIEKEKRVNVKGLSQYLSQEKGVLYALDVDPWIEQGTTIHEPVQDGDHCRIVIFGAGIGGLCAAVRLITEGAVKNVDEILIVDLAGGFGGTWYWNRFPGAMCDIESYIYLPCLEETGYMPKRKYASGEEIRSYCDLLAGQFDLKKRALFQSSGKSLTWSKDHWVCDITEKPHGLPEKKIKITADFVVLASGTFTYPKLPDLSGLGSFNGQMLHTARWRYDITGGTPTNQELTKLSGKRVALIGTGATAIQAVPVVAQYAGELYIVQRTPSVVDVRNNRDTDPQEWKTKIASKKGWQMARGENFQAFLENTSAPEENLVNDGWTTMPSISGAWGGNISVKAEDVVQFMSDIQELDVERSERLRQRALDVVKDPETAKKLQAWYPGWCKRPCFHDEYLQAFNLSTVHLVDTDGRGVEDVTPNGIVANGEEYPVDIIIWSTGFGSPLKDSLAGKAEMTVFGKDGSDMDKLFKQGDLATMHGIIGYNFPNLYSLGLSQAGVGANQTQRLDIMSEYVAYTIREGTRKVGEGKKVIIEPTKKASSGWGDRVAGHAYLMANMMGCLSSYFNMEGEAFRAPPEVQAKAARNTLWGQGFSEYHKIVKEWQNRGDMEGMEVTAA